MKMSYKVLQKQTYTFENYSIVPIRYEDRFDIMKWRNEQIYHLRQNEPLTVEKQNTYFDTVVSRLFDSDKPGQILFSYLENDVCIGYGGLVHINWIDNNAEISFIMNTDFEKKYFDTHWSIFLQLLKEAAFRELRLHKIYTYAFDLRPHLYPVFEKNGLKKEAVFKEHCLCNGEYKDVVIHSIINMEVVE